MTDHKEGWERMLCFRSIKIEIRLGMIGLIRIWITDALSLVHYGIKRGENKNGILTLSNFYFFFSVTFIVGHFHSRLHVTG